MKLFANILTWVLHPVTLTIPGVYLLSFSQTGNISTSIYWTFISLIFSSIVASFVFYGIKKGFFNNIDVSNRKQRVILYPFVVGIVLAFSLFVYFFNGPSNLIKVSILFIFALVILDFINTKIKASIHVAGVSCFITGIVFFHNDLFYLLVLIPLVAWARVIEKKHTPKETIIGSICGITLTLVAIFIVQLM